MARLLRHHEVLARMGVSKSTLRRMEERGEFPKRFYLGPNLPVWHEDDVLEWLEERRRYNGSEPAAQDVVVGR